MAVTIDEVYRMIDEIAPFREAYDWDNSGCILRVNRETENILVALDLTDEAINDAIEKRCALIVTHHPAIFTATKRLDMRKEPDARIIRMISHGISLISAHTNMDKACLNTHLAEKLGLENIEVIGENYEPFYKITVFTPQTHENTIIEALASAGAGHIGNYSHCTFGAPGTGTFLPGEGTNPYIGRQGVLESVPETRIEAICPGDRVQGIVHAVKKAHPYEEPAIDVYALAEPKQVKGTARIGELESEYAPEAFLRLVKERLGFETMKYSVDTPKKIKRVAICSGGGASLIQDAFKSGADAYLTGEIKHSDYINTSGMLLIEAGHYDTEACFMDIMITSLQQSLNRLKCNVHVMKATTRRPYNFV